MKLFQLFERYKQKLIEKAEKKDFFLPMPKTAVWNDDHTVYLVKTQVKQKNRRIVYTFSVYREEDFIRLFRFEAKNINELIENVKKFCTFYRIPEKKLDLFI